MVFLFLFCFIFTSAHFATTSNYFDTHTSMCHLVVFLMPCAPACVTCGLKTLLGGAELPVSAGTWHQLCVCYFDVVAHE